MNKHTPREYIEARIIKNALALETNNITVLLSKKDQVSEDDWIDYMYEFRRSGNSTQLNPKRSSSHYEVDFVWELVFDRPIGWEYWHGGGKWGDEESIDWIDSAEFLQITNVEMVPKYTLVRSK